MSWINVIWLMSAGVCMTLATVHLLVWLRDRNVQESLAFSLWTAAVAVSLLFELSMMHAPTPEKYAVLLGMAAFPFAVVSISYIAFVRLYLRAGRRWLMWSAIGIVALELLVKVLVLPTLPYVEITGLHQIPLWGDTLLAPEGAKSLWSWTTWFIVILLFAFIGDAAVGAWRGGRQGRVKIVALAIFCSTVFTNGITILVLKAEHPAPVIIALPAMLTILVMAYGLSLDLLRANQISRDLLASRERMGLAAGAADLGIWEWDCGQDIFWIDEASRSRLGVGESDRLTIDRFLEAIHPDDREPIRRAMRHALEDGRNVEFEYRLATPGGAPRWLTARGHVVRGPNGKPILVRGISIDFTERKKTELELYRSEQLARSLLNATTDVTHLIDEDGIILDLNDAMAEALGGTRAELIGACVFDRLPSETADEGRNVIRKVLAEGKSLRYEDRNRPGRIFDTGIYPIETPAGEKGKVVVFAHDITDRKQAEIESRKSEAKFRRLVESVPDVIWTADETGKAIYVSENVVEHFGFNPKEIREDPNIWRSRIHPDDADRVLREFSALFETGKPLDIEYRLRHKDGHWIWLHDRSMSIYEKDGIKYADGLFSDISFRKQAEQDLKKSRDFLEHLTNSIPDAVFSAKLPERTIEWARDSYNVLGYNLDEFIGGKTDRLYSSVDEYLAFGELLKCAIRDNRDTVIAEVMLRNKKGESVPVEINSTIYRDEGEPVSVISLVRDISDRKKYQEKLEKSEARLKQAQRIARIGNWELDILTDTLTWSDEIFRIFEIDKERVVASYDSFISIVHPEDRETVYSAYAQSLRSDLSYDIMYRLLMPDGRIKYIQEQCETFFDPWGKPLRSMGTVQDITAIKQAENERIQLRNDLAHAQRVSTMGHISSALAHEINQPLGAILNNASTVQILSEQGKWGRTDPELGEILADIIADATRAGQVVRKIRGIVKKTEVKFERLNINVLVEEVAALYQNAFNLERITGFLDLQPDLFPVRGDRVHLQQVLMNLINNAGEAMRESDRKTIKIRSFMQSPDMVVVSVIDSGTGIDEVKKDKLFAQFFTTKKDGLGMGLDICRSIVEEHGGRIWVENNPGGGATFSFSLKAYRGDSG